MRANMRCQSLDEAAALLCQVQERVVEHPEIHVQEAFGVLSWAQCVLRFAFALFLNWRWRCRC